MMKFRFKKTAAGTVLLGTLLAASTMLSAQAPDTHTPPDPATMASHEVARLTKRLTLRADQQAAATTLFTTAFTALAPLEASLRADEKSLRTAVQSNASAIDQLSFSIGTLTGQISALRNHADASFYALLDAAQQTTLNSSGGFRGGFGPGGFGHGPGGPPPGRR